jgi:hypothetical protein
MVGEVPIGGIGHDADLPRCFTKYHGVRATGPSQLEAGGDQAVADGAPRTAPRLALGALPRRSAGFHEDRIVRNWWTASTFSVRVDSVH